MDHFKRSDRAAGAGSASARRRAGAALVKVLAVACSVSLAGAFVVYRAGAGSSTMPGSKSFRLTPEQQEAAARAGTPVASPNGGTATTGPASAPALTRGDVKVFVGSKSAAVMSPSDVRAAVTVLQPTSTQPATAPSTLPALPGQSAHQPQPQP